MKQNSFFLKILFLWSLIPFFKETLLYAGDKHWTFYGLRPLSMGNAFVSVASDFNCLFYNPAGLSKLESWDFEVLNPRVGVSQSSIQTYNEVKGATSASSTDAVLDLIDDNLGRNQYVSLGLSPYFVMPHFGFAIGLDVPTHLTFHRNIEVDVSTGPRLIAPIGFAKSVVDERLHVGVATKLLAKGGIDRVFTIADIDAFKSNKNNSSSNSSTSDQAPQIGDFVEGGIGVGFDAGLLFTPTKVMEPTFGFSVTDIGGSTYKEASVGEDQKLGAPATRLPSVNLGLSFKPIQLSWLYLLLAADAHSINQPLSFSQKMNFGAELGFWRLLKLDAGLYKGELTAGFELDFYILAIRAATYAEQLGPIAGTDKALSDRRYLVQLKLFI